MSKTEGSIWRKWDVGLTAGSGIFGALALKRHNIDELWLYFGLFLCGVGALTIRGTDGFGSDSAVIRRWRRPLGICLVAIGVIVAIYGVYWMITHEPKL